MSNLYDCRSGTPGVEVWVERLPGISEITPQTPAVTWACSGLHACGPAMYVIDQGGMVMVCQVGDRGPITEEMKERFALVEGQAYEIARRVFAELQKRAAGQMGLN